MQCLLNLDHASNSLECAVWWLSVWRLLACAIAGALLAAAGAMVQAVLRNPLAEPYVLGATGGASVGGLLMQLGLASALGFAADANTSALSFFYQTSFGALCGAGLSLLLLWRLSGGMPAAQQLLMGAMLSAVFGALISLCLALAPAAQLRGYVFWLLGDASGVVQGVQLIPALIVLATVIAFIFASALPILQQQLGAAWVQMLGVNEARLRLQCFAVIALAVTASFSLVGGLGFIGLAAPHIARRLCGQTRAVYFWLCMGIGAALLVCADLLAQHLLAPQTLPTGSITALLGAVFLIVLLRRKLALGLG